jgi:manganese/zinc/iron transport system permease protein
MPMDTLWMMLSDANTQWVLLGSLLLGVSSGILGSFALLRKHSLIGDAMAHAALPGICIAFLLYGTKTIGLFMIGAAIAGLLAAFFINFITKHSRIKEDTSLGLVLSVFFGFGIVLLTQIQHGSNGNQSGLDDFLFGQAASLVGIDVKMMTAVASVLLIVTFLLFKEFKLLSFDPNFGRGLGLPMGFINFLLMTLIVCSVVIGLQAVGVVLMAAMLITPAIAARYWTECLECMVLLAGLFGAASGIMGTLLSTMANNLPTGPLIVLSATLLFLVSLIFAPQRGLLMKAIRHLRTRNQVAKENVLKSFYDLTEQVLTSDTDRMRHSFTFEQIQERRPLSSWMMKRVLRLLEREGFIVSLASSNNDQFLWQFTERGITAAYDITKNQRMWEMFLMYESRFAGYKAERDQRLAARQIPQEATHELQQLLKTHHRQPNLTLENFCQLQKGYGYKWGEASSNVKESKGGGLA